MNNNVEINFISRILLLAASSVKMTLETKINYKVFSVQCGRYYLRMLFGYIRFIPIVMLDLWMPELDETTLFLKLLRIF